MRDLVSWRSTLKEGIKALSQGNSQELEKIIERTGIIQARLDISLPLARKESTTKDYRKIMLEIKGIEDTLIQELTKAKGIVKQKLDTLAKNKSLLQGYRNSSKTLPRFLNRLT